MGIVDYRLLVINPGSTSTKVAVYEDETQYAEASMRHPSADLKACGSIPQQQEYRLRSIKDFLETAGFPYSSLMQLLPGAAS